MFFRCLLQQRLIATIRQARPNASVPKRVFLPSDNPAHNFDPAAIQATLDSICFAFVFDSMR
jgi:hypothetical protein